MNIYRQSIDVWGEKVSILGQAPWAIETQVVSPKHMQIIKTPNGIDRLLKFIMHVSNIFATFTIVLIILSDNYRKGNNYVTLNF